MSTVPSRGDGRFGRRAGFTLIEMLVAAILAAVVMYATAEAFAMVLRGRDHLATKARDLTALRNTYETMARDIHSAVVPPDDSGVTFGLTSDPTTSSAVLQFASAVGQPVLLGRTANETALIQYMVQPDPRDQVPTLFRYETAYPVPSGGSAGTSPDTRMTPMLRGVASVQFSFYAADQQGWIQDWSSETGLPLAIRADVILQDPNADPKKPLDVNNLQDQPWVFTLPSAGYANDQAAAAANATAGANNTPSSTGSTPTTGGTP